MLGTICTGLINELDKIWQRPMVLIETGTLRDREPEPGDTEERSTLAIAKLLHSMDRRHQFCSIDSSAENIAISKEVLQAHGVRGQVAYYHGKSSESLLLITQKLNFVLLDSDTDPIVIYEEYKIVEPWMLINSIILIDDCFKQNIGVNKGKFALPHAKSTGRRIWNMRNQAAAVSFGPKTDEVLSHTAFATEITAQI